MSNKRRWRLCIACLAVALLLALLLAAVGRSPQAPPSRAPPNRDRPQVRDRTEPVNPLVELNRTRGLPVRTGMFIENLHSLSLRERTFGAEGYYWLEWPQPVQDLLKESGLEPIDLLDLTNQVNSWDALVEPTGKALPVPGGGYYQRFRFSAIFYIPDLDLRRSPFENLVLPVILEVKPIVFSRQRGNAILVPERSSRDSLLGEYAPINGYAIESVRLVTSDHSYGTSWGREAGDLEYSQLAMEVGIRGDLFSSFVTWILPLLIVMTIVLLGPSLGGSLGDVRLAIPSTALLTLIFLQQHYKGGLPPLNYLTFLDCLYAYSYLASLAIFILFVWGTNVYADAPEWDKSSALQRINRVDRILQVVAIVGFLLVGSIVWLT